MRFETYKIALVLVVSIVFLSTAQGCILLHEIEKLRGELGWTRAIVETDMSAIERRLESK